MALMYWVFKKTFEHRSNIARQVYFLFPSLVFLNLSMWNYLTYMCQGAIAFGYTFTFLLAWMAACGILIKGETPLYL